MNGWNGAACLIGNVASGDGVELRFSEKGAAIAKFAIAVSKKWNDKESCYFVDVTCFNKLAEHVAASVSKGDRVIVWGEWDPQQWEDKEGKTVRKLGLIAEEVGPSLKYAMAEISKVDRNEAPAAPRTAAPTEPVDDTELPF